MKKILFFILLLILGALAWWGSQYRSSNLPEAASSSPSRSERKAAQTKKIDLTPLLAELAAKQDPASARELLSKLRQKLDELSPEQAAFLVENYFASGEDAELSLTFEVDQNGQLKTAPTLRTALLDHLALINPEAAAALGRQILSEPTSADEWALALRNLARVETDSRDYLLEKTEQLIRNPDWQAQPSIGYLNAFDTLVHLQATEKTPLLSELVQRKDRQDLAHASFLTLDRLTLTATNDMLSLIASDQALQQARPEMAAQQLARADFRIESQRSTVREWLLDPQRTTTQLDTFAKTFPNGNLAISNNLLTSSTPFSGSDLRDRDLRSLETIDTWIHLPEFAPIKNHLETMSQRLTQFVNTSSE